MCFRKIENLIKRCKFYRKGYGIMHKVSIVLGTYNGEKYIADI